MFLILKKIFAINKFKKTCLFIVDNIIMINMQKTVCLYLIWFSSFRDLKFEKYKFSRESNLFKITLFLPQNLK